jgi:hypothetical protein
MMWGQTEIGGVKVRVGGIAKGSGMIHPNMATMLCVITSDAAVDESLWKSIVKQGAVNSFNQVRAPLPSDFSHGSQVQDYTQDLSRSVIQRMQGPSFKVQATLLCFHVQLNMLIWS